MSSQTLSPSSLSSGISSLFSASLYSCSSTDLISSLDSFSISSVIVSVFSRDFNLTFLIFSGFSPRDDTAVPSPRETPFWRGPIGSAFFTKPVAQFFNFSRSLLNILLNFNKMIWIKKFGFVNYLLRKFIFHNPYKYDFLFFIEMVNYKIYLFRHGKTFFQAAFQTRLSRSKNTLKYVLKFHPECKKIITDDRMIERSYGILEGVSHRKFINEIGKKLVDLKIEGNAIENLSPNERKKVGKFLGEEEYKTIHRGYSIAVPNGESFADVEKRVKKFIIYLKKFVKKNKINVAISAHGNSIRLFRKIMENASKDEATMWFIPYDKVFEYTIKG